MHAPKGFGKRYFSLTAIQAYAGAVTLHRCAASTYAHHRRVSDECEEESPVEEDDPQTLETVQRVLPGGGRRRSCHCNRFFHRRTCTTLRDHPRAKIPLSPYRYTHSTLSPPAAVPYRHLYPTYH
jgi:hypothetical protein